MTKYVLIYHNCPEPGDEVDMDKMMEDWRIWVEGMGANLLDPGTGVGMSKTVMSDGSVVDNGGSNPITGYCVIGADNMENALDKTKEHPFLNTGGSIEIAESWEH